MEIIFLAAPAGEDGSNRLLWSADVSDIAEIHVTQIDVRTHACKPLDQITTDPTLVAGPVRQLVSPITITSRKLVRELIIHQL